MVFETLLGIVTIGSAVIAGAAMTTKEKDKIIQPTTINNINNSINNSFNTKKVTNTNQKKTTTSNTKDSCNTQTTQQSAEIDHDKIVDELYMRYKMDKNEDNLNDLLEKLNNL